MPKVARKAFNIMEVWNPVCWHGNKTVRLIVELVAPAGQNPRRHPRIPHAYTYVDKEYLLRM